jgi:hypothetical protein
VSEAERVVAVRAGHWRATMPGGPPSGFHYDAFVSLMMSYEAIAEDTLKARTETRRRASPTWCWRCPTSSRATRRTGRSCSTASRSTSSAATCRRAACCWSASPTCRCAASGSRSRLRAQRRIWSVDALYIDGDTSRARRPVFEQLRRETLERRFPDAFGGERTIDALGVDSGYRANVVYAWVRRPAPAP